MLEGVSDFAGQVKQTTPEIGVAHIFRLAGILSQILAVTNLLPLPPLDGSHMLLSALRPILPVRRHQSLAIALKMAGVIIMTTLLVAWVIKDVLHFSG